MFRMMHSLGLLILIKNKALLVRFGKDLLSFEQVILVNCKNFKAKLAPVRVSKPNPRRTILLDETIFI